MSTGGCQYVDRGARTEGLPGTLTALTDPGRLARWYGQVAGDLRPGGEFRLEAVVTMAR
jgi:hypothetical protein